MEVKTVKVRLKDEYNFLDYNKIYDAELSYNIDLSTITIKGIIYPSSYFHIIDPIEEYLDEL